MTMDGKPAGKHFAGPTWEFTDGSRLTARVADKSEAKSDKDIPWLKLAVDAFHRTCRRAIDRNSSWIPSSTGCRTSGA